MATGVAGPLLTTDYVIIELFDALAAEPLRSLAVQTTELLRNDPAVSVVAASTALLDEGIALFTSRPDKRWGVTDCISFNIMKRAGATSAITAERHFEHGGFDALLRRPPEE